MILTNRNKIVLEPHEEQFLRDNWSSMTNQELADALGLRLTKCREFLYKMGLKRMELQYWTPDQILFLKNNYKKYGDTELAEIFEVKWHKPKGWTKKHIEKKRRYLKLKRTEAERKKIRKRNTLMGRFKICNEKRWLATGVTPVGEKRVWRHNDNPLVVIKTKEGFVHYNRWLWQKHYGEIPKGMNVRNFSPDKINYTINDLRLITNAENSALNSKNRIPKELKEIIKIKNELETLINKNK